MRTVSQTMAESLSMCAIISGLADFPMTEGKGYILWIDIQNARDSLCGVQDAGKTLLASLIEDELRTNSPITPIFVDPEDLAW